ncbi:hypothetical protein VTN02DRAFT_6179 [Thermoascus thermophilus]
MLSTDERFLEPAVVGLPCAPVAMPDSKHRSAEVPSQGVNPRELQHIWIITGPAGCGKTTVAKGLQAELGLPFIEGDDFHSQANKEKMSNGIPLTDADRWDWLISLREAAIKTLSSSNGASRQPPSGVIVTCSALKQKYRDVMRVAAYGHPSVQIHFIYLKAEESVLMERVDGRQAHYMKSTMVHSQFEALEEPLEEWDALAVDVAAPPDEVMKRVSAVVAAKLREYQ